MKACEKTTVPVPEIEKMAIQILQELRAEERVEVPSERIGQLVAEHLKKVDKIAYIRFASVFRRFVDIEDFEREVQKLLK